MKKIELAIKRGLFYLLSAIFKRWFGNMPMIELEQKHIEGCEVLINRDLLLQKLPKNASPVRLKNRCQLTGRPKGYMRYFGLSRIMFRDMALNGMIPGVKKASW